MAARKPLLNARTAPSRRGSRMGLRSAWAASHYSVHKHVTAGRTVCEISRLEEKERVEELARMAGGTEVTDKARGHARALLSTARNTKSRL